MTHLRVICFVVFSAIVLLSESGCNPMPNGGVPVYVRVDSPTLIIDDPNGFGPSTSQHITDVWAYDGGHNLGAYEMPVTIPVLDQGNLFMAFNAGIYDNGVVNIRAQYPFYAPDTFTLRNAVPGQVYHHHPVFHYFSGTRIGLNQNFEQGGTNATGFTHMTKVSGPGSVFDGFASGGIIMTPTDSVDTAVQITPMTINTHGRNAYLELNYRSNAPTGSNMGIYTDVGIIATKWDASHTTKESENYFSNVRLIPKGAWNKTYLNFSNEAGYNQGAEFQVYFVTWRLPGTTDTFFVDNIRFVYFD